MSKPLTFPQLAHAALEAAPEPLDRMGLWQLITEKGLDKRLKSKGKTPWETLAARLYVDVRENPDSPFMGIGRRPVRFWLKSRPLPKGWSAESAPASAGKQKPEDGGKAKSTPSYLERDLHPLVAHFAFEKMDGVRIKTINHSASRKKQFGEWVHPDLIGVLFPMTALGEDVTVNFSFAMQTPLIRLYSFELKRKVSFGNLRESFFQAVSNSSWAHEGYLVAVDWLDDPEFHDELSRLSQAFGIGAIRLDLEDPGSGEILLPARTRDEIDWATLDKLVAMNKDVRAFLESVRIDLGARRAHEAEYDEVLEDAGAYASALLSGSAKTKAKPRKAKN
jgi:hypothetical protein